MTATYLLCEILKAHWILYCTVSFESLPADLFAAIYFPSLLSCVCVCTFMCLIHHYFAMA